MLMYVPPAVCPRAFHVCTPAAVRGPGLRTTVPGIAPAVCMDDVAQALASAPATAEPLPPADSTTEAFARKAAVTLRTTMTLALAGSTDCAGVRDADGDACSGVDETAAFATEGDRLCKGKGGEVVGDTVAAPLAELCEVVDVDGVADGDAPTERLEVPVLESELDEAGEVETVGVFDGDDPLESVAEAVQEALGVVEGVGETLKVDEAVAGEERELDGDALFRVLEPVLEPVPVPELVLVPVPVTVPVGDALGVCDALEMLVTLKVLLSLPVFDGLAPFVSDAVGVCVTDRERLNVGDGVLDDVGVPVEEGDPVGVPLSVSVDVVEGVPVLLGVLDALAPCVKLGVAVLETDEESVVVELGVCVGVPLVDAVGVPVDVPDGVSVALRVDEAV